WMQIWAFAFGEPPGDDTARRMLKVVPNLLRATVSDQPEIPRADHIYFAQAEFYLDCRGKWFTACNNFNLGTFKIAWRARLRRVKQPDLAADMFTMLLGSWIGSDSFRDFARKHVKVLNKLGDGWQGRLVWLIPNLGSNFGFSALKTTILYEANAV